MGKMQCKHSFSKSIFSFPALIELLVQLQSQVNEEKISKFNITRSDVLDDARRSIRRKSFCPKYKMDVRFTDTFGASEGAIDEGGPKREFLRMLMLQLQQLPVFEGPESERVLSSNAVAVQDELFKDIGVFIALSICHGGPTPKFLSEVIYTYLVFGLNKARKQVRLNHIADPELRMHVTKIQNADTLEKLVETMDDMAALLIAAGCYRPITEVNQKERLVEDFTTFLVLGRTSTALHQFAEGLNTLEVLNTCKRYPETMRSLFIHDYDQKMTADLMEVIFNKVEYSPNGSNARVKEEKVIGFWMDFLIDIEEEDGSLKLSDVLVFATGVDRAPPLGFNPEPSVKFTHSSHPRANTCALELHLPLLDSYSEFKEKMVYGILNSPGFGTA